MVYFYHSSKHFNFFTWTLLNFIVIYILNSINYQYRFRLSQQIGCVVLLIISILISILLIIIFIIIIIIIMCCCCCCCCYIGKSFRHSWYIQYGRSIDIVFISLLFSEFASLQALWLTKSSKLFKTLYCTQNFLPMKIWKLGPVFSNHWSFVLNHLAFSFCSLSWFW